MKNKKGFTLIELLAVIVVLAIIALIVTPIVSNIVKSVKLSSLKTSAYGLIESAKLYSMQYRPESLVRFDIIDNEVVSTSANKIKYNGHAGNGVLVIEPNMKVAVCLTDGVNSVYKGTDENEVTLVRDKICSIASGTSIVNLTDSKIDVDLAFDTISLMKASSDTSNGQIVQTKGFDVINDGGGAYYEITNESLTPNEMTVIALNNGLYAKLMVQSRMSVKQFGAVGDGVTDEHLAFEAAIKSGAESVYIPLGTYEINNNIITTNSFIKLIGNGQSTTTIKNGTIKSQYGISAMDITFNGGATQHIDYVGTHALDEDGTIVFFVTPNGERDVIYKNCTFKNITVASFARDENDIPAGSKLSNSIAENCTFEDLGKLAIYHSVTLDNAVYTNNTFTNLGSTDLLRGFVSGLMIGDITNTTEREAVNLVIRDNIFTNLYTHDDFEESVHAINANFIAVKADKAIIDNNTFTNLVGYGHDREGIYTKVRDLTVSNNRLTNAGLGEGYICAKPHDGITFSNILNNTFDGDAGTAIRTYSPALISGNTVNILNVPTGITGTISSLVTVADNSLTISNNIFRAGTASTLDVNGTTVTDYNKDKFISLSSVNVPVIIDGNTFNTVTKFNHYISIGNPDSIVTINNNTYDLSDKSGVGMFMFTPNAGSASSLNSVITITGNHFNVGAGFNMARVRLFNPTDTTSARLVTFSNNDIVYNGTDTAKVLICETSEGNGDRLIVNNNTINKTKAKTSVTSQFKYFETDSPDFATFTLSNNS